MRPRRAWALVALLARLSGALVPLASLSTGAWLATTDFPAVDGATGTLRPRLAHLDADPLTVGVMEARDVGAVAALLAASFAPSVVIELSGAATPTWEDRALGGVARAAKRYDEAEYAFGLRARCGPRLAAPCVDDATHDGSLVLAVARPSGAECVVRSVETNHWFGSAQATFKLP